MDDNLISVPIDNAANPTIIKVLGVGGGGGHSVEYLQKNGGIEGVSLFICNTDRQTLDQSKVTDKIQLGAGTGAGGDPEKARMLAEESKDLIREKLSDGTKMLFLLAGMGGGTGTGASPVIAEVAQELGILTVGIVTTPFLFERKAKMRKAVAGTRALSEHVDAIVVINNENLHTQIFDAFNKVNEVVGNITRSIAEIITVPAIVNTDFQDVYNTLKDGRVAIINTGIASGPQRVTKAIENVIDSPLMNNTNIYAAKRILMQLHCSEEYQIQDDELQEINAFTERVGNGEVEVQWGLTRDDSLGENVKITIIATGYDNYVFENNEVLSLDATKSTDSGRHTVTFVPSDPTDKSVSTEGDNVIEFVPYEDNSKSKSNLIPDECMRGRRKN